MKAERLTLQTIHSPDWQLLNTGSELCCVLCASSDGKLILLKGSPTISECVNELFSRKQSLGESIHILLCICTHTRLFFLGDLLLHLFTPNPILISLLCSMNAKWGTGKKNGVKNHQDFMVLLFFPLSCFPSNVFTVILQTVFRPHTLLIYTLGEKNKVSIGNSPKLKLNQY